MRTVPELLAENSRHYGKRLAFADDRRGVSWSDLAHRTARLAAGLAVDRGARVAFCLDNSVELVEGFLAALRAAAVGVPLSPRATDAELATSILDCDPDVLVTDRRHLPQIARTTTRARLVVTGDGPLPDNTERFDDLAAAGPPRDDLGLDEPAWLMYTSGTTGAPKAAVFNQRSALWSPIACYVPLLGLSATDRLLWPLPMAHTYAHSVCVLGTIVAAASARITSVQEPAALARVITEYAPTVMAGVPLSYERLLDTDLTEVPSLRLCITAGAPCDHEVRQRFEQRFGAPLLDGYGSTETCGKIAIETPHGPRVPGSSGPPAPGMDVRLVDPDTGQDGEEGEIWVRGPSVMLGYHNQPPIGHDGWWHTGDLGRLGAHGCLTVIGRVSDRIVSGGEKINPAEVERVLVGLPDVLDAAVVAQPHPLLGQVPVAFVVPASGDVDPARLLRRCAEVLPTHKVPDEVLFTSAIPRTAAGKTRRAVLRATLDTPPLVRFA
ncbi:class I adenylate-forming enzyme family protein [Actinophytocola sp.]|uniref:class I adenylate-forming enzyme family protein n=1 Tax=Actinophytocola sp. TaxID=1872138 RepID=UPI00389985C2